MQGCLLSAVRYRLTAYRSWPFPRTLVILSGSEGWSVDQPKGKPSYGQAMGQLWSTRAFYAECAQYSKHMRQSVANTSRREGCRLAVRAAESVNPACSVVHPCATTWPSSPRWEACHWIFRSLRSPTNPVPLPPKGDARRYVFTFCVSSAA